MKAWEIRPRSQGLQTRKGDGGERETLTTDWLKGHEVWDVLGSAVRALETWRDSGAGLSKWNDPETKSTNRPEEPITGEQGISSDTAMCPCMRPGLTGEGNSNVIQNHPQTHPEEHWTMGQGTRGPVNFTYDAKHQRCSLCQPVPCMRSPKPHSVSHTTQHDHLAQNLTHAHSFPKKVSPRVRLSLLALGLQ